MKKIVNFRLSLFSAISLCIGILCAYFIFLSKIFAFIICMCIYAICILTGIFLFSEKEKRKYSVIYSLVFTVFLAFGAISFSVITTRFDSANLDEGYYTVTGRVSEITESDSNCKVVLDKLTLSGKQNIKTKYKLALTVYNAREIELGDIITFTDSVYDKTSIYDEKFACYDIASGVKYYRDIIYDDITVIKGNKNIFEKTNLYVKRTLSDGLSDNSFPIAYALLTGNSDYMEDEVLSNFRATGVAHIFAVSGLHIGILATALAFILSKLGCPKPLKALIVVVICLLYSGVCGFSASSMRATIMCAVMYIAGLWGDRYDGLSAVGVASLIILIISPIQLFCVGFQLSFGVVIGIMILGEPLSKLLKFLPRKLAVSLASVISAQLVSVPICISAFGNFSVVSILANLLLLPVVSVFYVMLFVSVAFGFIAPDIILYPSDLILKAVYYLITVFDYKVFIVSGIALGGFSLLYYLALIISSGIINLKRSVKTVVSLSLAVICLICATFGKITFDKETRIYVSGAEKISATLIHTEDNDTLVISKVSKLFSVSRLNKISKKTGIYKLDNVILLEDGSKNDIQLIATKLSTVFDVGVITYMGEEDEVLKRVMKKSFINTEVVALCEDQEITVGKLKYAYRLSGRCLDVFSNGKRIVIFAEQGIDRPHYYGLNGKIDYVITYDYTDIIEGLYNPDKVISYRISQKYTDAERKGNIMVRI